MKLSYADFNVPFTFTRRPEPIPPDLRPDWQIALIVLILNSVCRGKSASITKVHVVSWALRSDDNMRSFESLQRGDVQPSRVIVRYDPSLNRAIDVALGEGLITRMKGRKIALTKLGEEFSKSIEVSSNCLARELAFLSVLKRISEKQIDQIVEEVK